ncbi:MAG: TetR/AcrR family transcriptional regulator [Roseburia sp.]
MELRENILEGTIQAFNQKGLKFTMDDLAGILGMSKKTIYTVFRDKESLFFAMVDYLFDSIKESERAVLADRNLGTAEKIRAILGVLPEGYREIDFRQLYLLREKYPKIYKRVEERLESGWETTISLLEQGMEEGVIRRVRLPILKMMLEAALEQFFQRDILIRNGISYGEALDEVVDILMDGIAVPASAERSPLEADSSAAVGKKEG